MKKTLELHKFLQNAVSKSQKCQRNWDTEVSIPKEDLETLKHAVTQCPSKQNIAHYKVSFITDRDLIQDIFKSTKGFYTKEDLSEAEYNSQVLANLLVVFEDHNVENARAPEYKAFHSASDTPEDQQNLVERDQWMSVGIASGMLALTANMLGYRTGYCACFNVEEVVKKLNPNSNSSSMPLLMLGIGVPKKGYLRIYNQDNTYAYPTFTKQEIPIKFI